jgi:hypothetical protein
MSEISYDYSKALQNKEEKRGVNRISTSFETPHKVLYPKLGLL